MTDTLFTRWTATVERAPKALALVEASTGRRWTRAALASFVADWSDAHAGRRLAGCRVAMSAPNGAEWFQVFLGLLAARAVPAPVDPTEPEDAMAAAAASIAAPWIWRRGRLEAVDPGAPPRRRRPASECLVKLTSGSTGAPKGLPFTHAQMEADGMQVCRSMGIESGDSNLAAIPLGYSYGLGSLVVPLLIQGTQVVCASSTLPHAISADCARHRPTVFPTVPPVLRALALSDVPRRSLSSLRLVVSAGSALDPDIALAFSEKFGTRVHGFYGASETGGVAFDSSGDATLSGRSVGRPLGGVDVTFGARGRFTVSSPAVSGGGAFSPRDRAILGDGGELVLLGRVDRAVKVGGRRVDLAEIEATLRTLPGIRDAFAHLVPGPDGVLAAAVATGLAGPEVRRLLRARLASWKVPHRVLPMGELPVTPRGKVDARKLRQLLAAPRTTASISTLSASRQMSAPR